MQTFTLRALLLLLGVLLGRSAYAQRIAAGTSHTVSIHADGTLWAWGDNGQGQLGISAAYYQPTPAQVGTATTWLSVAANSAHTLAIRQDGTLWAWGENSQGQLGLGTINQQNTPAQVGTATTWLSVATSYSHTLAVRADGTLWAWGLNNYGELGNGTTSTSVQLTPVQVGTATTWLRVAATAGASVAIRTDGTLWAWGNNNQSQLGLGAAITQQTTPAQVGTSTTWQSVALGDTHGLAVRQNGTLWAWGNNYSGQLGLGAAITQQATPTQVGTATTWLSVAAGSAHSVALRTDGTLWTWGDNTYGQLGSGSTTRQPQSLPAQVGTVASWQSIAAGEIHTVALRQNGTLWTWGINTNGQIGDGSGYQLTPTQVAAPSTWRSVAAGQVFSAGIRTDGTLWTWGYNYSRQLANGTDIVAQNTPTQISTAATWQTVAAGASHAAAIRQDGTLWAWGGNYYGQVGNNSSLSPLSPVQIGTATWKAVAAGSTHTVAIRQDGTLWAWGNNNQRQLGTGTVATQQSTPIQVGTATNWQAVACGANHTLALKTDGTLWVWGAGGNGQLGLSGATGASVPTQLGTATWLNAAGGDYHSLAVRADGTLWAWGYNDGGQLGTGNTTSQLTPVQIGTATTWQRVTASYSNSAAIRQNGTLWTWGSNYAGESGTGTVGLPLLTTPAQVGTVSSWQTISAGGSHVLATRLDGTLWAWGYNAGGMLGLPDFAPSPVYIPTGGVALATVGATAAATWQLAPNPAHGRVQLLGLPNGPVIVRLLDAQGRLVRTATTAEVSLDGLAPGLYLLQATADHTTRTQRLVLE